MQAGLAVITARDVGAFSAIPPATNVRLIIVDLNTAHESVEAVRLLTTQWPGVRITAFVSHVDRDLATAAEQAGASDVWPRSRFVSDLSTLLIEAAR